MKYGPDEKDNDKVNREQHREQYIPKKTELIWRHRTREALSKEINKLSRKKYKNNKLPGKIRKSKLQLWIY